jgi:hypothetical protein
MLAYRTLPAVRAWALGLDLALLTALQSWRVLGGGFLMLHAFGLLPALFAWPAGLGDVLVGAFAPFATLAVLRQTPGWRARVLWLNLAGLVDFVAAVGTGVLTSQAIGLLPGEPPQTLMAQLPLSLIPTFAVPVWIILHLVSLAQLRERQAPAVQ